MPHAELSPLINRPDEVTATELATVSERLWGVPVYGGVADLFLDRYRTPWRVGYADALDGTQQYVLECQSGEPSFEPIAQNYHMPVHNRTDPQQVHRWLRRIWNAERVPYELTIRPEPEIEAQGWTAKAGTLSRHRLLRWLMANQFDQHGLHGSLGKALDVLNVTASAVEADLLVPADRRVYDTLISYEHFRLGLQDSKLSTHYKDKLRDLFHGALRTQISTGHSRGGEIIIEGAAERIATERRTSFVRPEHISVQSLHHLARYFSKSGMVYEELSRVLYPLAKIRDTL